MYVCVQGLHRCARVKNPPANAGDIKRRRFNPWVGKIPWRRAWQPTPVFLPRESHGQRSVVGYSPWGHKRWTEYTHVIVLKREEGPRSQEMHLLWKMEKTRNLTVP